MTQYELAVGIFLTAFVLMWMGYYFVRLRTLLMGIGFFFMMSGSFTSYSNWLPQSRGEVPVELKVEGDILSMPADKLAELGEIIIFGKVGGMDARGIGKGQCPLCHTFKAGQLGERAPNLIGLSVTSDQRVADQSYMTSDTVQNEAFSGSGRARSAIEYVAESHACPSCYVVKDFGVKGSNDRESPMPSIHKAPIGLSIDELIAVDTWLWFREGVTPPEPTVIKAAYEKFIPEKDRAVKSEEPAGPVAGLDPKKIALPDDSPEQMITKMACYACHRIPTIEVARTGAVGPLLVEGSSAHNRIKSPEYQQAVKDGKAHAQTPRDYVIESIMDPSAFIVAGFPAPGGKSMMPPNFSDKFTYAAVAKLADFLLSVDEEAAVKDGLDRLPQEKEGSLLK